MKKTERLHSGLGGQGPGYRKFAKKLMSKQMRKAARRDPEDAPQKRPSHGTC